MCHATWREGVFDTAEIILSAGSGASASVHVNWITPTKIRSIRVTGTRGVCFVDYILQTCELLGGSLLRTKEPSISSYDAIQELYKATDRIQFGVQKVEPLRAQADQFLQFLATGELGELCHGRDALSAVILAERAIQAERGRSKRAPLPPSDALAALDDEWI
jgi:UDP-N-acetylglucosamine 3-dehydrogenase